MKRFVPFISWAIALSLIAFVLIHYESDLLWKVQQYNLFLDNAIFFRDRMLVAGGLLSYASCYFTQFFFYPWMGVLILCGWWLLLMWLTKRAFRITDNWAVLALIPIAILLIANIHLGYWHYFMKLQGYFYVATIGTTATVALLWAFRKLPQKLWQRIAWIILAAAIAYPLLGAYGLAAILLMAVWNWRLSANHKDNAIISAVALLCIIAIPLIYYRYVYYQTNLELIWTTALPTFNILKSYPLHYIPYYILGGFYLLMTIFYQKSLPAKWKKPLFQRGFQAILAVVLIISVWLFWYKDSNFHHELAMQHCIENTDWEGVLSEGQKQGDEEPTRSICMMHQLAQWRLGRQLDEMYSFTMGDKRPDTELPLNMLYHVSGRMLYYQYGLLNDCHRICMEDGVEYGWHVELLKYMARCSLLGGETQAAKKILNLLRHTHYYGKWADAMLKMIDTPQQIAETREMGPISHMMQYGSAISGNIGDVENHILTVLARQGSDDLYFAEQAVVATIWLKNERLFWPRLSQYIRLQPNSLPRIFQEAAYLFGKLENRSDLDQLPFDNSVKEAYNAFTESSFSSNYANTYFYYYYSK